MTDEKLVLNHLDDFRGPSDHRRDELLPHHFHNECARAPIFRVSANILRDLDSSSEVTRPLNKQRDTQAKNN